MKKFLTPVIVSLTLLPISVFAQQYERIPRLEQVATNLTRYAAGAIVAVSVLFIIYAAFIYLLSQGEPDQVKKARDILIYAFIGIAIAVAAIVLRDIVINIVDQITSGA